MLQMYTVSGFFCYGAYSEVLVWAESGEEAIDIVRKEALTDGMYETFSKFPEEITVECWGLPSKGIISASGVDC